MKTKIIVKKKGQTPIPVKVRKKNKIEEGTRLRVVETEEGVLLKPKKSILDKLGYTLSLKSLEK